MKKSKHRNVAKDSAKLQNLKHVVNELEDMSSELQKVPRTGMIVEMPSFMESDIEEPSSNQKQDESGSEISDLPSLTSPKNQKVKAGGFDTIDLEEWLNKIYNAALKNKGQKSQENPLESFKISLQQLISAGVSPEIINQLYTAMYQASTLHECFKKSSKNMQSETAESLKEAIDLLQNYMLSQSNQSDLAQQLQDEVIAGVAKYEKKKQKKKDMQAMFEEKIKNLNGNLRDRTIEFEGKVMGLNKQIESNKKKYDGEVGARYKVEKRINKQAQQLVETEVKFKSQVKKLNDLQNENRAYNRDAFAFKQQIAKLESESFKFEAETKQQDRVIKLFKQKRADLEMKIKYDEEKLLKLKNDVGNWTDAYSLQTKELTSTNLKLESMTGERDALVKEAKGLADQVAQQDNQVLQQRERLSLTEADLSKTKEDLGRLDLNFIRVSDSDKLNREGFEKYQALSREFEIRAEKAEELADRAEIENDKLKQINAQMQIEVKHALRQSEEATDQRRIVEEREAEQKIELVEVYAQFENLKKKYETVMKKEGDDFNTISNLNVELNNANVVVEMTKQASVTKQATNTETIQDLSGHVKDNSELIEILQNDKSQLHIERTSLNAQISELTAESFKYAQSNVKLQESHDKVMAQLRDCLNEKKKAIIDATCLRSDKEDLVRRLETERAQHNIAEKDRNLAMAKTNNKYDYIIQDLELQKVRLQMRCEDIRTRASMCQIAYKKQTEIVKEYEEKLEVQNNQIAEFTLANDSIFERAKGFEGAMRDLKIELITVKKKVVDLDEESKYYNEKYTKKAEKLYILRNRDPTEVELALRAAQSTIQELREEKARAMAIRLACQDRGTQAELWLKEKGIQTDKPKKKKKKVILNRSPTQSPDIINDKASGDHKSIERKSTDRRSTEKQMTHKQSNSSYASSRPTPSPIPHDMSKRTAGDLSSLDYAHMDQLTNEEISIRDLHRQPYDVKQMQSGPTVQTKKYLNMAKLLQDSGGLPNDQLRINEFMKIQNAEELRKIGSRRNQSMEKQSNPTPTRLFMALPSITPSSMRPSEMFEGNATLAPRLPKFQKHHDPKNINKYSLNKSYEVSVRKRKVYDIFPDVDSPDSDNEIGRGWPSPSSPGDITLEDQHGESHDLSSNNAHTIDNLTPQPMFKSRVRQKHAVNLQHRAEHIIKAHLRAANSRNKDAVDFYNFDP